MPRPRTPKAKAEITGYADKKRTKFENRVEPTVDEDIGSPPLWMTERQRESWRVLSDEIPWLNKSHRAHLSIAVVIHARLCANEDVGVQALNLLRQCLGQMGANPADASKAGGKPDGEGEDPANEFFG
ncbi:hypothetical protein [Hansschlegelia beijingensis]|uniref:Terminase n=1 Tax=Hansschlegelia beijingensis TaxID=1133344 RepID=A0A7W6GEZ8_9HYPH|nr:hypothetical protein [Hansschlegelia beijingensis]MBB3972770.1 hypothetical protein [Hansschlegelia beijingensis]